MRRYDDPVEVRKGMVGDTEGPEQFLWRGRLWKVSDVVAHWEATGPWWQSSGEHAVLGAEETGSAGQERSAGRALPAGRARRDLAPQDLTAEREVWRVEATRGRSAVGHGRGVFDLVFDWAQGSWQLARCVD